LQLLGHKDVATAITFRLTWLQVKRILYGSKVIDIAKGKNSVEVSNGVELIAVLETLKSACELGELDQQISVSADAVRARFKK